MVPASLVVGLVLATALMIVVARAKLAVVRVHGVSMQPTLAAGDRVLLLRRRGGRISTGSIVVMTHRESAGWLVGSGNTANCTAMRYTYAGHVIKRVAAVAGEPVPKAVIPATGDVRVVPHGCLVVLGDSLESQDSRTWGFVRVEDVIGRVVLRLQG